MGGGESFFVFFYLKSDKLIMLSPRSLKLDVFYKIGEEFSMTLIDSPILDYGILGFKFIFDLN